MQANISKGRTVAKSKPKWTKRHMQYNIRSLARNRKKFVNSLTYRSKLLILAAHSSKPPKATTEYTTTKITSDASVLVPCSYDGWSRSICMSYARNGVDGILFPKTKKNKGRQRYWTRIWFGQRVMYLQMKFHPNTPQEFWKMVVLPYQRPGRSNNIVNKMYIEDPAPKWQPPVYTNNYVPPPVYLPPPVYRPPPMVYYPICVPRRMCRPRRYCW